MRCATAGQGRQETKEKHGCVAADQGRHHAPRRCTGRARTEMIAYFHSNPALVVSVPLRPGCGPTRRFGKCNNKHGGPRHTHRFKRHLDEARLRHEPLVAKVVLGQRQEQPAPVRPVACNTAVRSAWCARQERRQRAPPHLNTAARESSKGSARIASIRSTFRPHTDSTAQRAARGRGTQHGQGPPHFLQPFCTALRLHSWRRSGRSTQTPHLRCPKSVRRSRVSGPPPTAVFNLASSATTVSAGSRTSASPLQRGDAEQLLRAARHPDAPRRGSAERHPWTTRRRQHGPRHELWDAVEQRHSGTPPLGPASDAPHSPPEKYKWWSQEDGQCRFPSTALAPGPRTEPSHAADVRRASPLENTRAHTAPDTAAA